MRNRHANDLAGIVAAREWRVGALDAQINVVAYEAQVSIAHQDAWQQASLTQDLEAVTDAEHQSAVRGIGTHRAHDWTTRGDCPATQVVAIGKSPRDYDQVGSGGEFCVGVPHHGRLASSDQARRARHVTLAVDAGKDKDRGFHPSTSTL